MLTNSEKQVLTRCVLDEHFIVQVEVNNPLPGSVSSVSITDQNELSWLLNYSIQHGRDLQSLFRVGVCDYMTLYIDGDNINYDFEQKLLNFGLIESYRKESPTAITISFPEKILK